MSLPQVVVSRLSDPRFARSEPTHVGATLARLGVSVSDTFAEFYRRYEGAFGSARSGYELLDLCSGEPSVGSSTEVCRAEFAIPDTYLVLTNFLGGGVLMYRTDTDEVFDVDLEGGHEALAAGGLKPTWRTFEEFLGEYFG